MPEEVMNEVGQKMIKQSEFDSLQRLARDRCAVRDACGRRAFRLPRGLREGQRRLRHRRGYHEISEEDMIVMHPLPRVTEISMDFDDYLCAGLLPADGIRPVCENGFAGNGSR